MQDKQPTLLLTRPKAQSVAFLAVCEKEIGQRLPVVISPIIQIEHREVLTNLDAYKTLIFTSANGVAALETALQGRQIVTVGTKTCEAARRAGGDVRSLGEDADAFLAQAHKITGPALHCRGAHARGNLAEMLTARGIQTADEVVYDQHAQPLTQAASSLLQSKDVVVVPLFSPRSARLLSKYAINADLRVVAMSKAVADEWSHHSSVDIALAPTAHDMALRTLRHF